MQMICILLDCSYCSKVFFMCTVCGLPTNHSTNLQTALTLGMLISGATTMYLGAKIILTTASIRRVATRLKSYYTHRTYAPHHPPKRNS